MSFRIPIWEHPLSLLVCLAVPLGLAAAPSMQKKLIVTGWDSPNTAQFRRNLKAMEICPFNGAVVYAEGRRTDGKSFTSRQTFDTNHWERSFFSEALEDLKTAHSDKLTDNFLLCGANPGKVDWFDDVAWKEIANHWRILAWLAHEGRMKGLAFDPEAYTPPFNQFDYGSQAGISQHTYPEYSQKSRERGREIMRAISSEFPNVIINCYYIFSYSTAAVLPGADQAVELANSTTGLLPPFADGWFDVLPSSALVIDGNERAYYYSESASFDSAYIQIKNDCQALVSPENRAKFRAQLEVSHGIFLDLHLNLRASQVNRSAKASSGGGKLAEDVLCALAATDEYVWIYGQKAHWWPPNHLQEPISPTWTHIFPGVELDLLCALNPSEGAKQRLIELKKRGNISNLVRNGDFHSSNAGSPDGWGIYQTSDSHGNLSFDPNEGASARGSARLSAVKRGCFIQAIKFEPRQRAVLSARILQSGQGAPWLRVEWENEDGILVAKNRNVGYGVPPYADHSTWRDIFGTIIVPEGALRMRLTLGVTGQHSAEDRVWFDDVLVANWDD